MEASEALAPVHDKDVLSGEEVTAAFGSLTDADMLRLRRAEEHYRHGTDFAEGDLLHGTFCQLMLGERRCPRGVGFVRILAMAMRSTAGHRRAHLKKHVPLDAPLPASGAEHRVAPADWLRCDGLDPEAHMIENERTSVVDAMLAIFADDEETQLVILGVVEGLRGTPLCEATGLTSNRLHYVFRKMRKRLGKDRDGWKP